MRRYTRNLADARSDAVRMRETFVDRPAEYEEDMPWSWPAVMQEVGQCGAIMYRSNKWKATRSEQEDYKHVAEDGQRVMVTPGFLVDAASRLTRPLPCVGPMVDLNGPLPRHFAILATLLGIQIRLYEGTAAEPVLPSGDAGLYEVTIAHGMLGAARHPGTDEPFLFCYTRSGGVHCIITGDSLDVEKDGITG